MINIKMLLNVTQKIASDGIHIAVISVMYQTKQQICNAKEWIWPGKYHPIT